MNNPLLHGDQLPAFSKINPELIEPAISELIEHNRRSIAELESQLQQ